MRERGKLSWTLYFFHIWWHCTKLVGKPIPHGLRACEWHLGMHNSEFLENVLERGELNLTKHPDRRALALLQAMPIALCTVKHCSSWHVQSEGVTQSCTAGANREIVIYGTKAVVALNVMNSLGVRDGNNSTLSCTAATPNGSCSGSSQFFWGFCTFLTLKNGHDVVKVYGIEVSIPIYRSVIN